jgi:signal transduction histidine kinase
VIVAGQPAGLVGCQGRARLFEEAGDASNLREAAEDFGSALHRGGWAIDRATFEVDEELLQRWGVPTAPRASIDRTDAAIHLWHTWQAGELATRGRVLLHDATTSHLAIWTGGPVQPVVWLAGPDDLDRLASPMTTAQSVRVSGHDSEGRRLFGEGQAGGVSLMPSDTRLPFILSVSPIDSAADAGDSLRRVVLVSTLSVAFALMAAAAYGLYRATTRELTLARQQTDFVSAVSHEFRTPLTSMRHLMDLLVTRGVVNDDRRAHYYRLLAHETERLHRMVESLLSFGRIEAGAYAWKLQPVDAGALLRQVVDEFRGEPQVKDREIRCEVAEHLPPIRVDADALSRAVWNLLENAAKYSPPGTPIDLRAACVDGTVRIIVQDRGPGIPPEDHARVFEKFARGTAATRTGISGVGIGLALVKRIVEAHGGRMILESQPGLGSTFTIELPIGQAQGPRPKAQGELVPQASSLAPQAARSRQRSA